MNYELFYLIGASREADVEKIKENVKKMATDLDAVFEEKETMEKRKMSYKIKHETHGIYVAQRFSIEPEKIREINSKLNLYPEVLRFIISKTAELPPLRSREERIGEDSARSASRKEAERKSAKEATAKPEVKEKKEEIQKPAQKEDDIDKKLEEILNI